MIVSNETFDAFAKHRLNPRSEEFQDLKSRHFVADSPTFGLIRILAERYRLRKSFLSGFTKLHIFVITLRCEHSCLYCQVSRQSSDKLRYDMSLESAERAVDLMFESPAQRITVEFQGGEPLLNWELLEKLVTMVEKRNKHHRKEVSFVVATNLALITDEILEFSKEHNIRISTSLDGPAFIHDANRPRPGRNSHALTTAGIERARKILGAERVSALMTTSRLSLDHPIEIIDEYVRQGFRSIFLRPISPYGFAVRTQDRTGYDFGKFMQFYKTGLEYILDLNRRGINFQEAYAKIILTKILTPFPTGYVDLQSPSGLGISVVVYNYDGDVYASDEARMLAEMGDKRFRLGNVHANSYREIFLSKALTSTLYGSSIETLPGCADCAFQPFCGVDPVYHHTVQGDIIGHRPTSDFHKRNFEIIKLLFHYLIDGKREVRRIFLAWVTDRSVSEIELEAQLA